MIQRTQSFESLLAHCIARLTEGEATTEELCQQYAQHASRLRQRLEPLERFGLLETISTFQRDRTLPVRRLGPYPVLGELGRGGMGTVYLGRDPALDRWVALKVIECDDAVLAELLPRFRAEARVLAALQHPHIATVHGIDTNGPRPFIVMELVRGVSLLEKISKDPRARVRDALEWGRAIASALDKAHRNGVVHRDLKPGNVVLDPDGVIKVLDFGLAWRESQSLEDASESGGFEGLVGTPGYLSPEQALGQSVDSGSDLFALGALLFECLAGAPAFPGEDVTARIRATIESDPPWDRLPPMDSAFSTLLERCLAKKRRQRPRDAREVMEQFATLQRRADLDLPHEVVRVTPRIGPTFIDRFVGRRTLLPELSDRIRRSRLLTVVGLPGVGKTRVVSELVNGWLDRAIPRRLWIEASKLQDRAEQLPVEIGAEEALLVVDGDSSDVAEHRERLRTLFERCPRLRIVSTARSPLGLSGEVLHRLAPLEIRDPDPDDPSHVMHEAVALLLDRAEAVSPVPIREDDLAHVHTLCQRVDGHPAGIEILADQLARTTLRDLIDLPDRARLELEHGGHRQRESHRSLSRLVRSCEETLDPEARRVFRRLAVFGGGWELEEAHRVCAPGLDSAEWRRQHGALVGASLVDLVTSDLSGATRYHLRRFVRAAARLQLERTEELSSTCARHREEVLARVTEIVDLPEPEKPRLDRLDLHRANAEAALESAIEFGDAARGLRLAALLGRYWTVRGRWTEGSQLCERLLDLSGGEDHDRSRVASTLGTLRLQLGEYSVASAALESALELHRSLGQIREQCSTLNCLARCDLFVGEPRRARARLEESLRFLETIEEQPGETERSTALTLLANVAQFEGDIPEAIQRFEECLAVAKTRGEEYLAAASLHNLGDLAMQVGDLKRAEASYTQAIEMNRALGNQEFLARNLAALATLHRTSERYDDARRGFLEAFEIQLELGDRDAIARLLASLALFVSEIGAHRLATLFLGALDARAAAFVDAFPDEAKVRLAACRQSARTALGSSAFEQATQRGGVASLRDLARALREE